MELQEQIARYVESLLDESHFLVEVLFNEKGGRARLTVLLDGDKGITIDQCASISRRLAAWLEEKDLIKTAYVLEVSSPGIGQPLKMLRQYRANIGRMLKVETADGATHRGKLDKVSETDIVLLPQTVKKTGKKAVKNETPEQPLSIPFAQIAKAVVEISFD